MVYISLIRGINVGGKKSIKNDDLLALYESLNFENIMVHIQSGNVIFSSKKVDADSIVDDIEQAFRNKFNFDVSVIIRSYPEFKKIMKANPFLSDITIDQDKLHITFLRDIPKKNALGNLETIETDSDKYAVQDREVYLYCPHGYGRTKLSNNFLEKILSTKATTRKWLRLLKILELAETGA